MDWFEIKDPTNEITIKCDWSDIRKEYSPMDIQKKINEKGIVAMVGEVNNHFWAITNSKPLLLGWVDNKKALINREY